ncbi:hypothetical protein ACFQ9X_26010 [Catenulispora yoronensis]
MAEGEQGGVDPARAADLVEFIDLLGQRRVEAGSPRSAPWPRPSGP